MLSDEENLSAELDKLGYTGKQKVYTGRNFY